MIDSVVKGGGGVKLLAVAFLVVTLARVLLANRLVPAEIAGSPYLAKAGRKCGTG